MHSHEIRQDLHIVFHSLHHANLNTKLHYKIHCEIHCGIHYKIHCEIHCEIHYEIHYEIRRLLQSTAKRKGRQSSNLMLLIILFGNRQHTQDPNNSNSYGGAGRKCLVKAIA